MEKVPYLGLVLNFGILRKSLVINADACRLICLHCLHKHGRFSCQPEHTV